MQALAQHQKGRFFVLAGFQRAAVLGAPLVTFPASGKSPGCRAERLQSHARLLRQELLQHGLEVLPGTTPIIPLLTYDTAATMDLAEACLQAGLVVSGIRPPTVPQGTSRLRLSLNASMSWEKLTPLPRLIAQAMVEHKDRIDK